MPTLTSTGVGSGLDVNGIVTSLMALERRPLSQLQQRAGEMQTRLSTFGTLKGQLAGLGDVARQLATAAAWNPLNATSSDSQAATASAGAAASAGRWRLEVQQLAQAQSLASAAFAQGAESVVGTGSLTFTLGTTSGGAFTPRAGATPVTVAIDASKQGLTGVRDAINAAGAGVTASIVGTGATTRLVLRGASGADSSVKITVADDDGNPLDAAGLSALAHDPAAAAGAGRNLTQTQAAQDAKYTLDGLAMTSPTNAPADAIAGVTLTLRQVTTAPVEVAVAVETMAVRKNVNDFVNAYNALARQLAQSTQADPSGKNRGPLQADATAQALLASLRGLLFEPVAGRAAPATLSAAGLELQRDGTLKVNEARLGPLLAQPATLAGLFGQPQAGSDAATRGIGLRFAAWAEAFTRDGGALAGRMDGIRRASTDNQKQQDALQDRLARTETRLRAQYQRLDSQMSGLNAQMARMKSSLGIDAG